MYTKYLTFQRIRFHDVKQIFHIVKQKLCKIENPAGLRSRAGTLKPMKKTDQT